MVELGSASEINCISQVNNTNLGSTRLDQNVGAHINIQGINTHIVISRDGLLLESYRLTGMDNYGLWAYRMKNLLKCYSLFTRCLQESSIFPTIVEEKGRELALSTLTGNAKGNALRLMRRFADPYQLWQHLKERYEANNNPRKVYLIEKFISTKKTRSMSMDEYLTEMKETTYLLEDAGVPLLADIVVWFTLKNLPQEYDILKQMILCNSLPTYNKLELRLLSEEMSRKGERIDKREGEALIASYSNSRHTFAKGQDNRFSSQNYGQSLNLNNGRANNGLQFPNSGGSY